MPLKKTVAMERRIDLASLFCMIARHGPAVILMMLGIGCVVAGFVMLKKMREKRRRKAAEADRRDTNAGHGDAALGLEEEEERSALGIKRKGSTDVSDESFSDDFKEHIYQPHGPVRQRRTASERNPYRHKEPDRDEAIDKAQHSFFWEWNSHRTQSYAEEAVQSLEKSSTHRSEAVTQEVREGKEPEPDVGCEEEEKIPEADSSEDLTTTIEDMSDEEFRQEDAVQFTLNSQFASCPAADFSLNDDTSLTQQHLESYLENATGLVTEEVAHKGEEGIVDLVNGTNDQSNSLNKEKPADILGNDKATSANLSVEVMEELLPVSSQKSEPSKLEDSSLTQNESPMSPISDEQIDQGGLCLQEQLHHTTEVQTDKDLSTSQKDIEIVEKEIPSAVSSDTLGAPLLDAIPQPHDVNVAEIQTVKLPESTCLQVQQSQEILSQVQNGNQACIDVLSDQKDETTEEQQTTPIYKETDPNVADYVEVESSGMESKQVEGLEQSQPSPNQLTEVLNEETSSPTVVKTEIPSITDTTKTQDLDTETNILPGMENENRKDVNDVTSETPSIMDTNVQPKDQKEHAVIQELKPETTIPHGLENESERDAKGVTSDKIEISTSMMKDKIECIVEQIVADAYEEVRQSSVESKSVQLEENTLEQPSLVGQAQDSVSVDKNVVSQGTGEVFQKESKELVFCSKMAAQITEEVVNMVCSLEVTKLQKVESQKDVVSSETSNSFSQINDSKVEEKAEQETEVPIPSGDINLIQSAANERKSTLLEENVSLEQNSEKADNENIDYDNSAKDQNTTIEQENNGDLSSSMAIPIQAEIANTVYCPEVTNTNSEPTTEIKTETVENLKKAEEMPIMEEIQPVITPDTKTEVLENTATSNVVEIEQKDSSSTVKSGSKVVIVYQTWESSASVIEMSDDEDVDGISSHLEQKSSEFSTCQDQLEDKTTPANDKVVLGVGANTLIEETTSQEASKEADLTSGAVLDSSQHNTTAMKSLEQITLKDNDESSPSLESGISSMAVSPEVEEASNDNVEEFVPTRTLQDTITTGQEFKAEEKASHSIVTSTEVVTVNVVDSGTMVIEPLSSSPVQLSTPEDISNESLVTNEDSFGSEIEDGYLKAMEDVLMQVVDNAKSIIVDEMKKVDKEKEQTCAASKEGEKVDLEKTEISIMEATMDHNEWITDGSYQVLPWMMPTSSKDASSKDGVDIAANKQSNQTSSIEDGTDNAKKVLAVQPMPQNVNVTFRVHYLPLSPYQTVAVTGDQQELGAWKGVVPLEKTKDGFWSCVVGLPAESHVEWKFVVLEKGEVCRWEECGNRLLYTGYGDDLLVHKWWGLL